MLLVTLVPGAGRAAELTRYVIEPFVVHEDETPVRSLDWIESQVVHANRLFAPAGIAFELGPVQRIGARDARIDGPGQRDALGRHARTAGRIHLFVVHTLIDLSDPDVHLHGVHWRLRRERAQTWVILSHKDESGTVLAHELGHLFGLKHSRAVKSIMNKTPRAEPPWPERIFTGTELRTIERTSDRLKRKRLRPPKQPVR